MIPPFRFGIAEFRRRTPTTDLYVLNPLRRLAEEMDRELPRVVHLFGNVYSVGATCIISRTASLEDLRRLRARKPRRIVYVVDDNFEAGADDRFLPDAYRAKLAAFVAGPLREIKSMANVVLASSPVIASAYGSKGTVIQPAWRNPPAGFDHFEQRSTFEIAHLGTASHGFDIAVLNDTMHYILAANPNARFTLFSAASGPDLLRPHPQIRARRAMPWWLYKLVVPRLRFHLAIYPLRDTDFNASRSANKLFEHAIVGAASLMTPNPALRDAAGSQASDVFVTGGADAWRDRILADATHPEACCDRAARTRARILASDPLDAAARLWRDILTLEHGRA